MPQLELFSPSRLSRKESGAYYTPDHVVRSLVRWAVRAPTDLMLDPACGDGRFIAAHPNSVGVERDSRAAALAVRRASGSRVHEGDFFAWAAAAAERFDCAAGNPPFIRYQTFRGEDRARAFRLCADLGVEFSGLTASWAPFLVATAGLLRPGGRMAFVVPAAIGHAPYAAPLLEYLVGNFAAVRVVAIRENCFLNFRRTAGCSMPAVTAAPPTESILRYLIVSTPRPRRRKRPFRFRSANGADHGIVVFDPICSASARVRCTRR